MKDILLAIRTAGAIVGLALSLATAAAANEVHHPCDARLLAGKGCVDGRVPADIPFPGGPPPSGGPGFTENRRPPQGGVYGWEEEAVFEEDPSVPCYVALGSPLGGEQPHPLSWPNPYLPISRARWLTIMRVLLSVPRPGYESLLDAVLRLFISGRQRLHRDLVRIHRKSTGGIRGLLHFMQGREDNRVVAELWWSGDEDEVKVAPIRQWYDPEILDKFELARFYRFRWERAVPLRVLRWIFGGRARDKYATLIIRLPPEEYDDLWLPAHGRYLTEDEWRDYIQRYDINDHYTNWSGSI